MSTISQGKGGEKNKTAAAMADNASSSGAPILEKEVFGGKTATDIAKGSGRPYNEAGNLGPNLMAPRDVGTSTSSGAMKGDVDRDREIRQLQSETRGKGGTQ